MEAGLMKEFLLTRSRIVTGPSCPWPSCRMPKD